MSDNLTDAIYDYLLTHTIGDLLVAIAEIIEVKQMEDALI